MITIIGKGNVGTHLSRALPSLHLKSSQTTDIPKDTELIVISVVDDAIEKVAVDIARALPDFNGIVAHTAGSVQANVLAPFFKNFGVVYPLQTFNKEIELPDYREIPVFIEGNNPDTELWLVNRMKEFFDSVTPLSSEKRKSLHLASVFACNFTNAMYAAAQEILEKEGLPFTLVRPLLHETARKAGIFLPQDCQTGPAKRNDRKVLDAHLAMLDSNPALQSLYTLISERIYQTSKTKTQS